MPLLKRSSPVALWQPSWFQRLLRSALILILFIAILVAVATFLRRDQPPSSFTIATGPAGSASYLAAENYHRIARDNGFDLEIVTSEDVQTRIDLLLSGEAQAGFVPSGAGAGLESDELRTLASVYYEPLWILYRREIAPNGPIDDLRELAGMRIALGPGSVNTERLARQLLALNGITDEDAQFVDLETDETVVQLGNGSLDVAFFVGAATEELIMPLLRNPSLDLVAVRRAAAYANRYRFLTTLTLPEGVIDLEQNLPAEEKLLLSAVANVVIRHDLHPDLIRLMTIALVETHEPGGLLENPFEFPNVNNTDFPISREYLAYLEQIRSGESKLDNLFPFRIAALIDRIYLFVVPALLILIPILFRSPTVYSALMRRRLYTWYELLRVIEKRAARVNLEEIAIAERALDEMERRLEERFSISRVYLAGYYDLRMHIALVREKLRRRQEAMRRASSSQSGDVGTDTSAGV